MSEKPSPTILTHGVDHVGLTVADLQQSVAFFVGCFGWRLLGEKPDYPAAFVGDGQTRVTLWQVSNNADFVASTGTAMSAFIIWPSKCFHWKICTSFIGVPQLGPESSWNFHRSHQEEARKSIV